MRQVTETINVYKFETAPREIKDKIIEQFSNCPYHYSHCMDERIETLKKVAELLDADLDYSLSCVPDRGEFIKFIPKYDGLNCQALWDAINVERDCPLTGVCYDHDFIDHLSKSNLLDAGKTEMHKGQNYVTINGLETACTEYIDSIHSEYESMLTDDYIADHCAANDYEFTEDGRIY